MSRRPVLQPLHRANVRPPDPSLSPAAQQSALEAVREVALKAQAAVLREKVEHIVVLMLENRSFDHLLGWLGPENGGLTGAEENPLLGKRPGSSGSISVFQTTETALPISPPHAGGATVQQIRGGAMDGFVQVFSDNRQEEIAEADPIDGRPPVAIPMAYYGPDALPAYRHLVQHHTICTRYHASVPAGTWPNRMYLYAGTSNGLFGNGKAFPRDDAYDARMPKRLLVDLLDEGDVAWRVYSHGIAWMRLFRDRRADVLGRKTKNFRHFDRDCRRGELPPVVFVDPNWGDVGLDGRANDDLAPGDLMNGQRLVADVYNALREMPEGQREKTLLVVTYDEHGGFFDHVAPGATLGRDPRETDARFATYGVRVPTFVVSAYAPAALADLQLDHASLHATIHRRFVPSAPFLGPRVKVADTLGALLTLDAPRAWPPAIEVPSQREERRADRRAERRAPSRDDEDGGVRAWVASLRDRDD